MTKWIWHTWSSITIFSPWGCRGPMKSITVVITGASTGIGFATAVDLAHDGHQVFAGVRKSEDGEKLRQAHSSIIPVLLDVNNEAQVQNVVQVIREKMKTKKLALINNAGVAVPGPIEALPLSEFRRQFETNVFGLISVTQAFLPLLRETQGRIVNISSIAGRVASPFLGAYAASKFAVEGLSDSLRREVSAFGVKVVLVEPGPIETPIWEKGLGQKDKMKEYMTPAFEKIYGSAINSFMKQVEDAVEHADPVDYVVDAIKQGLFSLNPQNRYLVGRQAKISGFLSQILPSKAIDTVISKRIN